jgi:hypothetical protein
MRQKTFMAFLSVMLVAPALCESSNGAIASTSSPPRRCEIRQKAWCIYFSDAAIQDQPATSTGYISTWTVRGSYWRDYPLVIQEPRGCREGLSDTIELRKFDKRFHWQGQGWIRTVVRLMTNGQCDLVLLSPTLTRDPAGSAFFAGLALIQACTTDTCEGAPIGGALRNAMDPSP